jgi:N-formylglutamate amidohydrolase
MKNSVKNGQESGLFEISKRKVMQKGFNPAFVAHNTVDFAVPVLVSVPHAGRDYPDALFTNLRLPPASLLRLEDRYADLLARQVIAEGVPTIIAHCARAWIDLNRDERDIDVEMVSGLDGRSAPTPSAKQRGGLGLIPRRLSGEGDIWKRPFAAADIDQRIMKFHRPYHAAVADALAQIRKKFGIAILLDLHSMPPVAASATGLAPRFVIGDHFGRSASSQLAHLLMAHIKRSGFAVALNHPYSGDHMLRHHGSVNDNIHALQLEVDRSLYLDATLREPSDGLRIAAGVVANLVHALADHASGTETMIAAE